MKKEKLHVLLVDDHAMVRQGLVYFLNSQGNFHVVGEAENGEEAIRQIEASSADVLSVNMHEISRADSAG